MLFTSGIKITAVFNNSRTVSSVCVASWVLANMTCLNAKLKVVSLEMDI